MHKFYAHSKEGKPVDEWQKLEEHLLNVADLTKKFADVFGAGDWADVTMLSLELKLAMLKKKYTELREGELREMARRELSNMKLEPNE